MRTAIRPLLLSASDSRMVSRLTQSMIQVLQTDTISDRGMRDVINGDLGLLTGFEFNLKGKLSGSLFVPFEGVIDRVAGTLSVDIASFVPSQMLAVPQGTTHFKIVSGGVDLDFETGVFVTETSETAILPWDITPTAVINHVNSVPANSAHPLFLVLGIVFYQEVNGSMYPLKNGAFNPLSIVGVDTL
ncbi:hypothetical protein [Flavobacterium sp. UBA6135]|uniref:hypothetical protein n=1 Tax=Flavobacterium sp. UBA6135 TaxID=1946553 RepID=UPI0032E50A4B